ncbi:MAG: prephenate dehydrogenase [Acidaminococcaceae bacterium]|nr:prephenate dehydrogenase [Acidaminococcaceae bacterium]
MKVVESGFRSTDWQQLTFAVVGMGLIGGSYAKALRRLGIKKIIGVDTDGEVLRQAQEQALIDEAVLKAGAELKATDVVICSVYPAATLGFVKSAVPFLKSDVLITDATGIKGSLPEDVQRLLTGRMEFIAGHPMAGRQGSGLGMSQAEIFDGANYIVVPAAFNSSEAIAWLSSFAYAIGCGQVVRVDAAEHDRIIAYTSNLPHALAIALINSASYNENTKYFIAGSFRDGTRVADINPYLWSDLFLANRENVLQELAAFRQQLERWSEALTANDATALQEMMREAAAKRKDLY